VVHQMNARARTPSMAITPIWTTVEGEALVIRKDNNHGLGDRSVPLFQPTPIHLPGGLQIEAATGGLLHSLVLTTCGRLFTWGENADGQLGRGGTYSTPGEVEFPSTSRIVQITCGAYYCAVLTEDGHVWTWGSNDYCQLGRGGNSQSPGKVCILFSLPLLPPPLAFLSA
jgi:alpha-tubulin suppressor-like RCC1 family protein